jgi:hypothetical protein
MSRFLILREEFAERRVPLMTSSISPFFWSEPSFAEITWRSPTRSISISKPSVLTQLIGIVAGSTGRSLTVESSSPGRFRARRTTPASKRPRSGGVEELDRARLALFLGPLEVVEDQVFVLDPGRDLDSTAPISGSILTSVLTV